MVETVAGLIITVAICSVIGWLVEKLVATIPSQLASWSWIARAVAYLVLIVWVLDKYGVYKVSTP